MHLAGKSLLDTAAEIASQVAETDVNSAILVGDEHEVNHAENSFFISHLIDIVDDCSILLLSEARLGEIAVQFLDGRLLVLSQPCSALIFGELKHSIIESLPQFDASSSNLVDRLAQLRVDRQNTSSLSGVSPFPFLVVNTRGRYNEPLDGFGGMSLLCDHDA